MIEIVPQINVVRLDFLLVQLLCGEDERARRLLSDRRRAARPRICTVLDD